MSEEVRLLLQRLYKQFYGLPENSFRNPNIFEHAGRTFGFVAGVGANRIIRQNLEWEFDTTDYVAGGGGYLASSATYRAFQARGWDLGVKNIVARFAGAAAGGVGGVLAATAYDLVRMGGYDVPDHFEEELQFNLDRTLDAAGDYFGAGLSDEAVVIVLSQQDGLAPSTAPLVVVHDQAKGIATEFRIVSDLVGDQVFARDLNDGLVLSRPLGASSDAGWVGVSVEEVERHLPPIPDGKLPTEDDIDQFINGDEGDDTLGGGAGQDQLSPDQDIIDSRFAGAIGRQLGSQLFAVFGNDNPVLGLTAGIAGQTVFSLVSDLAINGSSLDEGLNTLANTFDSQLGSSFSVSSGVGQLVSLGLNFATDPIDDLLDFSNPLVEQISDIAINTLANYAVTEVVAAVAGESAVGFLGISSEIVTVGPGLDKLVITTPNFSQLAINAAAGAIGSYIGSQLALLIVEPSFEASIGGSAGGLIGAKIGFALSGGSPVGTLIGAAIGAFLGTIFGSFFGSGGGTVAAEIHTGFDVNSGEFVITDGLSTIRGGDGSIATQAAERHMDIMNTLIDAVGGKTFAGGGTNHGFVQDSGDPVRYLAGDSTFGDFESAFNHNIRRMSNSLQIEGGDRYVKHVLANYTGGPVEGLFTDVGVALDYGSYLDNEVLFIETLEAGDPLHFAEWQNMLVRVAELGLDTADESDDVYRASYQGIQGTLNNTYTAAAFADVAAGSTFTVENDAATDTASSILVLDLDGDGLDLTNASDSAVLFDIDNDGFLEQTGWAGPSDGFLVIDNDGSGRIESVSEMVVTLGGTAAVAKIANMPGHVINVPVNIS